jgi:hypothetical protein
MALAAQTSGMRDAGSWDTSDEDLARLALSEKTDLRLAVARNLMASESVRNLAFASLIAEAGPVKLRELADEPSCPPLSRQQAKARIWWRQLTLRAKKPFQTETALVLPAEPGIVELVELLRQEANFLIVDPAGSLLARVLGITCGDVMAIPDETVDKACNASARTIRLMGLRHPKAGPEALAKRSKSTDWAERLAIAVNPACPPNILLMLKRDAHQLVAQQAHATELLKADDASRKQAIVASSGDGLDLGAIVNALSTRLGLVLGCRSWLLPDTQWWNCLTVEQRIGQPYAFGVGEALQAFPSVLSIVACHPDAKARKSIAFTRSTPAATLAMLAGDPENSVRAAAAFNQSTPAVTLAMLAGDPKKSVRDAVVSNRSTPAVTLAMLACDPKISVRHAVASNQSTPAATLTILANDPEDWVRTAAASNQSTPAATLAILANDPKDWVRSAVARNLAMSSDQAPNSHCYVRRGVAKILSTPLPSFEMLSTFELLSIDPDSTLRRRLAEDCSTPVSILVKLADDKDKDVRHAVAENPNTPVSLLELLGKDKDAKVRSAVAENVATPLALLEQLAVDASSAVRKAVPGMSTLSCRQVATRCIEAQSSTVSAERLLEMGRSGYWLVRLTAIGNPSYPAARHDADLAAVLATIESAMTDPVPVPDHTVLQVADLLLPLAALNLLPASSNAKQIAAAAKSNDWIERVGATLCEGVQPSLLRMLLDDEVPLVRQLAIRRLKEMEAA